MSLKNNLPTIITFRCLCGLLSIVISTVAFAQQQRANRTDSLSLSERQVIAQPMLNQAELTSSDVDPTWRAFLLYRTAGAWFALDPMHAIRVYRQAFDATTGDVPLRRDIQEAILDDLLPLAPRDVLELLPSAESKSQNRLYAAVINFFLFQGDYGAAVAAFDQAAANGVLPIRASMNLLASLPATEAGQRARLFRTALSYYQSHPDRSTGFQGFGWASVVAQFYRRVPPDLARESVEQVLADAKEQERLHPGSGTNMSVLGNSIEIHSRYDQQLFALAPVLKELNPARAKSLLEQHPDAAEALRKYPEGLKSFAPDSFAPRANVLEVSAVKPGGLTLYDNLQDWHNLSSLDMGLEFTIPRDLFTLGVTGSLVYYGTSPLEKSILGTSGKCPSDVLHGLELARTIPMQRTPDGMYARANLIQVIAERCTYYDSPEGARAAISEQLEILNGIHEEDRVGYLATAADLYLRLGDREAAAGVVEQGFDVARMLYDRELLLPNLQKVPSALWPAAEAYRRMVTLGVNASLDMTRGAIEDIPDANLRKMGRIMIARALLGVPVRRNMTIGENGAFCVTEADVTYDEF